MTDRIKIAISQKMKALREKLKYSQKEMAFLLGVSERTYQNWENGMHVNNKTLEVLYKNSKTNLEWIHKDDDDYYYIGEENVRYDEVSDHLKTIREHFKLQPIDMAKKFDISEEDYLSYENGRDMNIDMLYSLSDHYDISIDWLLSGRGSMFGDEVGAVSAIVETVNIPVISAKASAGYGQENFEVNVVDNLGVSKKLLLPYAPEKVRFLEITGDSMYPTLSQGDLVAVAEGVHDGDGLYVLNRGGFLFVKRLQFHMAEASLSIISDNPRYQREVLRENGGQDHFHIVGRVVLTINKGR